MPRSYTILQSQHPYYIKVRSRHPNWYGLSQSQVWDILSDQLYFARHAFNIKIYQFVLMKDHFDMIISTPDNNISSAMAYFLREATRELQRKTGRINYIFHGKHIRTIISSQQHYKNIYKYLYTKPLRAGSCSSVESYPFSTLNGLLGKSRLLIPVEADEILFSEVDRILEWLNRPTLVKHEIQIARALRRSTFALPRVNKKPCELETILY